MEHAYGAMIQYIALWLIAGCNVASLVMRARRKDHASDRLPATAHRATQYPEVAVPVRCSLPVTYAGVTEVCDRWRNHPSRCICDRELSDIADRIAPQSVVVIRDEEFEDTHT